MRVLLLLLITVLTFPSNEGKSLSADQPLSALSDRSNKPRLQKRSPDYYYDYDYYEDDDDTDHHTTRPPTTTTGSFHGFEKFIDGLKKLQDNLDKPDYAWDKVKGPATDDSAASLSSGNYSSDIHELLVLTEILKQLSMDEHHPTTTASPRGYLENVNSMLNIISRAFDAKIAPEERRKILHSVGGKEGSVQDAVAEVSQIYSEHLGEPAVSLPPPDMATLDGPAKLLNMTLRLMDVAQEEYEMKRREDGHYTDDGSSHVESLRRVIQDLHSLSDVNFKATTRRRQHTTRPPISSSNDDRCTAPYVDVAYKICLLPVLDRQLSWHDANQYCRHRGLVLAMDAGVIKGRKHFTYQLGLVGTRERWTLWVGGKLNDEGTWQWNDGTTIPNFFWSKNQPRVYEQDSSPAGTCMAIDGFAEYYGVALPCHHKRRFVCQKL